MKNRGENRRYTETNAPLPSTAEANRCPDNTAACLFWGTIWHAHHASCWCHNPSSFFSFSFLDIRLMVLALLPDKGLAGWVVTRFNLPIIILPSYQNKGFQGVLRRPDNHVIYVYKCLMSIRYGCSAFKPWSAYIYANHTEPQYEQSQHPRCLWYIHEPPHHLSWTNLLSAHLCLSKTHTKLDAITWLKISFDWPLLSSYLTNNLLHLSMPSTAKLESRISSPAQ